MPYLTPGGSSVCDLNDLSDYDSELRYISWSTKMIGAYCGIQELLTKQKQKIRLRGSPV